MKRLQKLTLFLASALMLSGCYEFDYEVTWWPHPEEWTTATSFTHCYSSIESLAIAGDKIWRMSAYGGGNADGGPRYPLKEEFFDGYNYALTSIAQLHRDGCNSDTVIHGNRIGQTGNLNLLHSDSSLTHFESIIPRDIEVSRGTDTYDIVQICDLAAHPGSSGGDLDDPEMHFFMSFRARRGLFSYAAGVMEVDLHWNGAYSRWEWQAKKVGSTEYVWMDKPNGGVFNSECMPISVTRLGQQETNYLVVGDPSDDEISVFDAFDIKAGPFDSVKTPDPSFDIKDITIEGRGDGHYDYGMVATLWGSPSQRELRHFAVFNDEFMDPDAFLVEPVDNSLDVITSRGYGVQSSTEYLYTFGDTVVRKRYKQD